MQAYSNPTENRLRKSSVLALPVSQVFCLPLWLNETDPKLFPEMIQLQIELRGLQPRGADPVFDWAIVAQEAARTLVVVGVLPANLDPEMHAEAYQAFDLSARYRPFPENTLTIWREQDKLAMAITRGPSLVYYQSLGEGEITTRVVQDISCAQVTLAMQDILMPLQRMLLWTPATPAEIAALKGALPLPIEQEECPPPVAPKQTWKLTPSVVGEARRARANRQWIIRGLALFLLLYLIGVGVLATRMIMLSRNVDDLKKWQADNQPALDLIQDGRAQWKDLGPVIDMKDYPLELLLEAYQSIPLDQLHLTEFDAGNHHLLIKGEAKNVAGAFQFFGKLKGDPYFAGYKLLMANPHPLPNDLASFQIEGAREGN